MSDEGEKAHEPTEKRLSDAREKGEIPRSNEVTTAASWAGFTLVCLTIGANSITSFAQSNIPLFYYADRLAPQFSQGGASEQIRWIREALLAIAPFFITPMIAVLAVILLQRGMIFTPSKLLPKLERISPLKNAAQKFGRRGLIEFAKSVVKLILSATLLTIFLAKEAETIAALAALSPSASTAQLLTLILRFLLYISLLTISIAVLDVLWQRYDHRQRNRMSHHDLKEEFRQSEGDPGLKARRRQKAEEVATRQMLTAVEQATVVIINPTHYAVALKWDPNSGRAPICLAKGVDEIALRIRVKAREKAIPLHSSPMTARALYASLNLGDEVQPEHFKAVAAAIRFADRVRKTNRKPQ